MHGDLSEEVIGAFFDIYNALGFGFLESVYGRAMQVELAVRGISTEREVPFQVHYKGGLIGEYRADLVVARTLVVECKAVDHLTASHEAQLLNYLHASGLSVGLLFNFGPRATFRRLARSSPRRFIPGDSR